MHLHDLNFSKIKFLLPPEISTGNKFGLNNADFGQNNERISSPLVHHLGVISAGLANRPRYAVEINTRSVLNEAPLHGAVWRLVEMFNSDEKETLLRFVDEELCYFKGEEEQTKHHMVQIWQTPFLKGDIMPSQHQDTMLYKIGNKDIVRAMAEAHTHRGLAFAFLWADRHSSTHCLVKRFSIHA